MSAHRSSRELSGRVEIEFHKRPNPIKRAAWWTALAAVLVSLAWLGYTTSRGQTAIYQGGDISTAHAMFENDCAKCHSLSNNLLTGSNFASANLTEGTWAPLRRLIGLDDEIHSVSNANCNICHVGTIHHSNQSPKHGDGAGELSCAICHREHEGDISLAAIADKHCTRCHNDLVVHTANGPPHFAEVISDFADPDGHPPFRIEQLIAMDKSVQPAKDADDKPLHHAHRVVEFFSRDGEPARWQDTARIRFNHQAHLKGMFNENGEPLTGEDGKAIKRRKGENAGELLAYPQSCADCHQVDTAGHYMKPIVYEQHCAQCHPLTFDTDKVVNQSSDDGTTEEQIAVTVPHESPEIVRGFLAELYSLRTSNRGVENKERTHDPLADLRQGFPGENFPVTLNSELAKAVRKKIRIDEEEFYPEDLIENEVARMKGQKVLFKENGACAFCHDVDPASADGETSPKIVAPNIPERWYAHSRFQHNSHRMLSCTECHGDLINGHPVWESRSTGDVLLPAKASCAKCHAGRDTFVQTESGQPLVGARSNCVECHAYHDHSKKDFNGQLTLELTADPAKKKNAPMQTDTK